MWTKEQIKERYEHHQQYSIGYDYKGSTLADCKWDPGIATRISQFCREPKHFLFIAGNTGNGKTRTCAGMIAWMADKVNSYRYWNERRLLAQVRESMEIGKGDYHTCLESFIDDEFVILDDLGSTGATPWRQEILLSFIDYRYNSTLPTMITTNCIREQIKQQLGERSYSRIFDARNIIIEKFDAPDHRQNSQRLPHHVRLS